LKRALILFGWVLHCLVKGNEFIESIQRLKEERNAIILAHVYQRGEVQEIADFVGDSLDLSRKAVDTDAEVIIFCGVQFMAETAAILNPSRAVLLPDKNAGCGLADMATAEKIIEFKKTLPPLKVVSYVNSSADVKAVSDICCTSANAIDVVNSLSCDTVLFVPDKNLGSHLAEHSNKKIILWNGYCYVHEHIQVSTLKSLKEAHPSAEIIVHPECPDDVRHMADFTGSTSQMSRYVNQSMKKEFIVGTEDNFLYRLKSDNPDTHFYPVDTICEGMNTITPEKVKLALEYMEGRVQVPEKIRVKAEKALDKMIDIS
jgi:quinolinate synthase